MVVSRAPAPAAEAAARFEAAAEQQTSLRELGPLFTRALGPFGVSAYAVGLLRRDGQPNVIYMTTWPRAWMELYAANGFIADDPLVAEAIANPEPFSWDEMKARRGLAGNRVIEAAAGFGWREGFAVPIHGPGEARGIVALAAERLQVPGAAARAALVRIARCGFATARRLHDRQAGPMALTRREREALALVARGLDDAAIGDALGVTRASAHMYVERAKRRLGAGTRAQAVATALGEGWL